jgi:hypothetical protein
MAIANYQAYCVILLIFLTWRHTTDIFELKLTLNIGKCSLYMVQESRQVRNINRMTQYAW